MDTNPNEGVRNNAIVVGCNDPKQLEKVAEKLKESFPEMFPCPMNKDIFNNAWDQIIKDFAQIKEDLKISQFIKDPNNVKEVLKTCALIRENVGDVNFSLKDLVDRSEMTYEQAKSVINLLYAFGFLAKRQEGSREVYLLIDTFDLKLEYISFLEKEAKTNLQAIQSIKRGIVKKANPNPVIKKSKPKVKSEAPKLS